jgi:hypothetical protein
MKGIFFLPSIFLQRVFDMDFPKKALYGVFELPLLRNAQKRHNKKVTQKKTNKYLPTSFSGYLADVRRFQYLFLTRWVKKRAKRGGWAIVLDGFCTCTWAFVFF